MLNVVKGADNGLKIASQNCRYDLTTDDVKALFEECNVAPCQRTYKLLSMAFYIGVQQGVKIGRRQAQ